MAEHRPSSRVPLAALAAVVALPALARCSADYTHEGKSRLLDEACTHNACSVQGAASVTSGPTADSTGLRVGPGQGVVQVPIPAFSHGVDDSYEIELLVSGRGSAQVTLFMRLSSCTGIPDASPDGASCLVPIESTPSVRLSGDFDWVAIGGSSGADAGATFQGLVVQVSVANDGSEIDVIDMRYTTYSSVTGCTISRPGGR